MLGKRRNFKYLEIVELRDAIICVLIQQIIENGAGLGRVPVPKVLPLPPDTLHQDDADRAAILFRSRHTYME